MQALVMGAVLVGGLAVGDGGDKGRVERPDAGEVQPFDLKGGWEGILYTGGGDTWSVKLGNGRGRFTASGGGRCIEQDYILDADEYGNVSVRFDPGGKSRPCLVKLESGRVHLCYSWAGQLPASFRPGPGEVLLVLRRPDPSRPKE
jgi:hypothetical protein